MHMILCTRGLSESGVTDGDWFCWPCHSLTLAVSSWLCPPECALESFYSWLCPCGSVLMNVPPGSALVAMLRGYAFVAICFVAMPSWLCLRGSCPRSCALVALPSWLCPCGCALAAVTSLLCALMYLLLGEHHCL